MFPLRWNFPFRKKDGSLVNIGDAMGGDYSLPTASTTTKGGIKVGRGLSMDGEQLNATPYSLPTASDEVKGGIKVGNGLSMDGEVLNNLNPTPYNLPTASDEIKGGVKVGDGLTMEGEVLKLASGGMKIYYKDFTFPTLPGTEIATGFYITQGVNTVDLNVTGYTPIACIAKDTYSHNIIASMHIYRYQNVDRYRLGPVISTDDSITSSDFELRVYYVPESDVVALS